MDGLKKIDMLNLFTEHHIIVWNNTIADAIQAVATRTTRVNKWGNLLYIQRN